MPTRATLIVIMRKLRQAMWKDTEDKDYDFWDSLIKYIIRLHIIVLVVLIIIFLAVIYL